MPLRYQKLGGLFVMVRCAVVLLVAFFTSTPAWALDVKSGLWEVTIEGMADVPKVCFTREFLDSGISNMNMPQGVECTNEYKENTPTLVVTHSVCTGTFAIEGDTRLDVLSLESMSVQSTSVMTVAGHEQNFSTTAQYKWLSSDCGDVKPINLEHLLE
jgi:hypothetical protein